MEIIEEDGKKYIKVVYTPPKGFEVEGERTWLFKELNIDEFMDLPVTEKLVEGKTLVGQHTAPIIFMLNIMMFKGEKITGKEPYRVLSFLKRELDDFLT